MAGRLAPRRERASLLGDFADGRFRDPAGDALLRALPRHRGRLCARWPGRSRSSPSSSHSASASLRPTCWWRRAAAGAAAAPAGTLDARAQRVLGGALAARRCGWSPCWWRQVGLGGALVRQADLAAAASLALARPPAHAGAAAGTATGRSSRAGDAGRASPAAGRQRRLLAPLRSSRHRRTRPPRRYRLRRCDGRLVPHLQGEQGAGIRPRSVARAPHRARNRAIRADWTRPSGHCGYLAASAAMASPSTPSMAPARPRVSRSRDC